MDDYETQAFSNRGEDTEQALRCLEEALDLLSLEGPGISLDRVVELVNRAYNMLDRNYGDLDDDYDPTRELDFNEIGRESGCISYEGDDSDDNDSYRWG